MTAYDSIERGAADECKPLTGRRPRTFTLTQLLVACGAVCVCAIGATMVVNTHAQLAPLSFSSSSSSSSFGRKCPIQDWVDDSLCKASPPGLSESKRQGRALLGSRRSSSSSSTPSCAKLPPRPKSSDSVSCNGHGWCHEGTTASGNKPHCDCDAGYGGSHCETKILNVEDLSIKVADIEEEMEKMAESAVETLEDEESDEESAPQPYVKIAGKALKGNGASGACSDRLSYGSSGIKACEEKCNQCDDCKGFVDNRDSSPPYCVFKSATNVYDKASKDWYAKPN